MNHLISLVLPNGAELVGQLIDQNENSITIRHPLVIRPIQTGQDTFNLQFFPHSFVNPDGQHTFFKSSVCSVVPDEHIPKQISDAYIKQTTGLILASSLDQMERR